MLGGFTDDVKAAFPVIAQRLRPRAQIEQAYRQTLSTHEEDNRQTVSAAEDILFTTFTKELADKVKINPKYVNRRGQELNNDLWEITKWFFTRYNEKNDDCRFTTGREAGTGPIAARRCTAWQKTSNPRPDRLPCPVS